MKKTRKQEKFLRKNKLFFVQNLVRHSNILNTKLPHCLTSVKHKRLLFTFLHGVK